MRFNRRPALRRPIRRRRAIAPVRLLAAAGATLALGAALAVAWGEGSEGITSIGDSADRAAISGFFASDGPAPSERPRDLTAASIVVRPAGHPEERGSRGPGIVAMDEPVLELSPSEPAPNVAENAETAEIPADSAGIDEDSRTIRWFNGRPIRPASTLTMTVTAYSPDERSCGASADGITASGYSVWTNGMKMVAADTSLLPFGTLVSVPGYDDGAPVPVLDKGGKIKGRRLDVLYATHEIAMEWGVRDLEVTVWEYADGKPDNFRTNHRRR